MSRSFDPPREHREKREPRIRGWRAPAPEDSRPAGPCQDARALHLSRLVPLWPSEIESRDLAAAQRVVAALERALRGERRRGRAGHWSYDMNRHMALAKALQAERARLADLRRNDTAQGKARLKTRGSPGETKSCCLSAM